VLSNHVPELSEIAEYLGLRSRISRIFNSAETGHEKPHPGAYLGVLRTLKETEAVWMIGDNADADVAGAEAAGILAILVRGYREEVRHCCEGCRRWWMLSKEDEDNAAE
jgi:putative hydrolase of the HAD superfamily